MGGNGVCPCELFMEYEGMGRTNVGKGYTQMLLWEKRDVKVMAARMRHLRPLQRLRRTDG